MESLKDRLLKRIRPGMSREQYDQAVLEEISRMVEYCEAVHDSEREERGPQ